MAPFSAMVVDPSMVAIKGEFVSTYTQSQDADHMDVVLLGQSEAQATTRVG
jgi:hypothetical protein